MALVILMSGINRVLVYSHILEDVLKMFNSIYDGFESAEAGDDADA